MLRNRIGRNVAIPADELLRRLPRERVRGTGQSTTEAAGRAPARAQRWSSPSFESVPEQVKPQVARIL